MNIDLISEKLKIDKEKAFEALPAIATIIEKTDMIDYAKSLGEMNSSNGLKVMIRVMSRMKDYEEELDEVLTLLFNVDTKELKGSEKLKLLQNILTEKDISDFF